MQLCATLPTTDAPTATDARAIKGLNRMRCAQDFITPCYLLSSRLMRVIYYCYILSENTGICCRYIIAESVIWISSINSVFPFDPQCLYLIKSNEVEQDRNLISDLVRVWKYQIEALINHWISSVFFWSNSFHSRHAFRELQELRSAYKRPVVIHTSLYSDLCVVLFDINSWNFHSENFHLEKIQNKIAIFRKL